MRVFVVLLLLAGCGAEDPPEGGAPAVGTISTGPSTGIEPL